MNSLVGYEKIDKYLVGGIIRDIYHEKEILDVDFIIVGKNGRFLIKDIAKKLNKNLSILKNKADETYRIMHKNKSYDFCLIEEKDFTSNILSRDFTINSIAYNLKDKKIIDLSNGLKDLDNKIIKITSVDSITDDPLRILRGIRFFAILENYEIEKKTLDNFKINSHLLKEIAPERIREELLKILNGNKTNDVMQFMKEFYIDKCLFGKNFDSLPEKFSNSIDEYKSNITKFSKEIKKDVETEPTLCGNILIWFLWSFPETYLKNNIEFYKKKVETFFKDFRFSNRELKFSQKLLTKINLIFEIIEKKQELPDWRVRETIHEFQNNNIILISALLSYGEMYNNKQIISSAYKMLGFLQNGDGLYFPRLLDGKDLKKMGVKEGPKMGEFLSKVLISQYTLKLNSRKEAIEYVMQLMDGDNL
jgi:tRNA nucleotidyltransferase/poly(A) polymerase